MKYPLYRRLANKGEWYLVDVFPSVRRLTMEARHQRKLDGRYAFSYRELVDSDPVYKSLPHYTLLVKPLEWNDDG